MGWTSNEFSHITNALTIPAGVFNQVQNQQNTDDENYNRKAIEPKAVPDP